MPLNLFSRRTRNTHPPAATGDAVITMGQASIQIQAAASNGDKPATFHLVANTGRPMGVAGYYDPVVIDLAGSEFDKDTTPVLADHDVRLRIGHTTVQTIEPTRILVDGIVSSESGIAKGFTADAKNGFPFQVSVGAQVLEAYQIPEGEQITVNKQTFSGPLIVASKSRIREISITVLGADNETSATISATAAAITALKGNPMSTPIQTSDIEAERQRIATINSMLSPPPGGWNHAAVEVESLRAKAIAGSIPMEELINAIFDVRELENIRASRPIISETSVNPLRGGGNAGWRGADGHLQLEAAMAFHAGVDVEKHYPERTVDAAKRLGVTSLMDAVKIAAQMEDRPFSSHNKDSMLKAAFSTTFFTDLLSNVAGKSLEEAYKSFPSAARLVARLLSPSDFKEHAGVRLTGDVIFKEVGETGQLEHGTLKDVGFNYRIATFGRSFGLSRQAIVNDDLDALDSIPRMMGRGAALAVEEAFWGLVLTNAGNFFHPNNGNQLDVPLGSDGLEAAVRLFLEQVDQENKPIGVVPRFLVVPPALKAEADRLFVSRTLNVGGGNANTSDRVTNANVFFGLYEPLAAPWIGSKGLPGGSDDAFYLFGSPDDVAAYGVAFLDGNDVPTVVQKEQPAGYLGVQFDGHLDLGVCQIDHRGAVMSTGEGDDLGSTGSTSA